MAFSKADLTGARTAQPFPTLKEEHRRQKRAVIAAAAAGVFAEKGFSSATMAEIAGAAGITPGTIYLYFGSKEELLFATVLEEIDDLERRMHRAQDGAGAPPAELQRMMHSYFEFWSERPHGFQMLMAGLGREARTKASAELVAEYDRRAGACLGLLRDVLTRGMESGAFRRIDPDTLTVGIWGACHGVLQLAISGGNPERFAGIPVTALFRQTCAALLEGIATS